MASAGFTRSAVAERYQLQAATHLGGFLAQPVGVPLVLAVHLHLLRPHRQAAVAVEVQTVVSADVRLLVLLPVAVLRFQELGQTRLRPFGSVGRRRR